MEHVNVILFDDFTALDALGPTEVLSKMKEHFSIKYFSINGGLINNSTGAKIQTETIEEIERDDILLIPGGFGTRGLVNNNKFVECIKDKSEQAKYVLTICTGSALLAKTGLLDNRNATSNKMAWDWVISQNKNVNWIKKARWVVDGKFYTSSGITAGIDMTLGFIADKFNKDISKKISNALEYIWHDNKDIDPFS
jgi:transcriptional regulator GlxA family with amidase domain